MDLTFSDNVIITNTGLAAQGYMWMSVKKMYKWIN